MKQTEKIEMFFNWLMDNNYFTLFLNRFTAKYNIKETTYTTILEKLQTINYQEFVFSILDTQFGQGDFDVEIMLMKWREYCDNNIQEDMKHFDDGDYIKYSVISFGIKTDYVAIVECFDDGFVSEYCSAVIHSEDEDLEGQIHYYDKYDYNEDYILFRKANDNEIKWLDKHLKEYGRMYFDKEKKELVEVD